MTFQHITQMSDYHSEVFLFMKFGLNISTLLILLKTVFPWLFFNCDRMSW